MNPTNTTAGQGFDPAQLLADELAGKYPDARGRFGPFGGRYIPETLSAAFEKLEAAVRELGANRVIFGSDAAGRSFGSQLGKVMGAEIPESARRLILGENLRRMLTPILRAKGRQV